MTLKDLGLLVLPVTPEGGANVTPCTDDDSLALSGSAAKVQMVALNLVQEIRSCV